MDAIIVTGGTAEEIAALACAVQEQQDVELDEKLNKRVLRIIQDRSESGRIFQ